MKRKLIQHGMSSLTVSLPSKWVKKNNLEKGDEVDIEESSGKITVSVERKHVSRKVDIDISNSSPMHRRMIGAAFKLGYDEIAVRFSSHEELKSIQELFREQFSGFEIMGQTRDTITIKNLGKDNFEEFQNVLKRFFFIANNISSELYDAAKAGDKEWLKNIALMKAESDKLADYLRRGINLDCDTGFKRNAPLYTVIEQLEKSIDRYRDLCLEISNSKKLGEKTLSLLKDLTHLQQSFYDFFYRKDNSEIIKFGREKYKFKENLDSFVLVAPKNDVLILMLISSISDILFDMNGPVLAITM